VVEFYRSCYQDNRSYLAYCTGLLMTTTLFSRLLNRALFSAGPDRIALGSLTGALLVDRWFIGRTVKHLRQQKGATGEGLSFSRVWGRRMGCPLAAATLCYLTGWAAAPVLLASSCIFLVVERANLGVQLNQLLQAAEEETGAAETDEAGNDPPRQPAGSGETPAWSQFLLPLPQISDFSTWVSPPAANRGHAVSRNTAPPATGEEALSLGQRMEEELKACEFFDGINKNSEVSTRGGALWDKFEKEYQSLRDRQRAWQAAAGASNARMVESCGQQLLFVNAIRRTLELLLWSRELEAARQKVKESIQLAQDALDQAQISPEKKTVMENHAHARDDCLNTIFYGARRDSGEIQSVHHIVMQLSFSDSTIVPQIEWDLSQLELHARQAERLIETSSNLRALLYLLLLRREILEHQGRLQSLILDTRDEYTGLKKKLYECIDLAGGLVRLLNDRLADRSEVAPSTRWLEKWSFQFEKFRALCDETTAVATKLQEHHFPKKEYYRLVQLSFVFWNLACRIRAPGANPSPFDQLPLEDLNKITELVRRLPEADLEWSLRRGYRRLAPEVHSDRGGQDDRFVALQKQEQFDRVSVRVLTAWTDARVANSSQVSQDRAELVELLGVGPPTHRREQDGKQNNGNAGLLTDQTAQSVQNGQITLTADQTVQVDGIDGID
jgi:hypothetical protein